jgi:hypothetical protein
MFPISSHAPTVFGYTVSDAVGIVDVRGPFRVRSSRVRSSARLRATLRDHTARLLLSPGFWPAVEALADVLLEYRELSGEEAVSVIEQALDGAAVS